jgi:acyl-CoA thioesterase-1
MVHEFAEQSGGHLILRSKKGKGTTPSLVRLSRSGAVMCIMCRFAIVVFILGVGSGHANSLNIVVVGASNTAGWGVGAANAFPARLQTILKERGIDAKVTSAGVIGDTTAGMLRRIDSAVPNNTNIVILQPGTNDLRFFGSKQQRAANIAAMIDRLRRRHIRVIVLDPVIPRDFLQWDGVHYTAATHSKFAMTLAAQITGGQSGRRLPGALMDSQGKRQLTPPNEAAPFKRGP